MTEEAAVPEATIRAQRLRRRLLNNEGYELTSEQYQEIEFNIGEFGTAADSLFIYVIPIGREKHLYSTQARAWLHKSGEWATFPEGHNGCQTTDE